LQANEAVDAARAAARLAVCVREAGLLARSMFGGALKTWYKDALYKDALYKDAWHKDASSPVSEADIAVDRLLHERLRGDGGDFGWLSEETADDPGRLDQRYVWIVDPIDGTRAFIAGQPDWVVAAALTDNGRPIAACLYAPVSDELFVAAAGKGATRNGVAIVTTPGSALARARVAGPKLFLEKLATAAPPFTAMPRLPSLALRLVRVAQGVFDVAIAGPNSHDWDLAAADLLVHEAGGAMTTFAGEPVTYNRPVPRHGALIAAGRDRHATLIDLLRDRRIAYS
jgi:myo-inositol-1(or 4)-monophosphatase